MTAPSSFLPRLSLASRSDHPILPLHNPKDSTIRKKPSEYDLEVLSPHPHDALLSSEMQVQAQSRRYSSPGRQSPSSAFSDHASTNGSASRSRTSKERALFAGPPPPIAASRVLYRDEEEQDDSRASRPMHVSYSFAQNVSSVLFDRSSSSRTVRDQAPPAYEPDTIWRSLERRERALQKELQYLLDAQSAGLAANLDPSAASDAGSNTPTTSASPYASHSPSSRTRREVAFSSGPSSIASTRGAEGPDHHVVPVRQPRHKPPSLRSARAGLTRTMGHLADLKVEEDAQLETALLARRKALAALHRLATQRNGVAEELAALEADGEDPLARELVELKSERDEVAGEIAELEERLVGLRNRKRWLDGRIADTQNKREAGLSGYRGALKDAEGRLAGLLRRPAVRPLDLQSIAGGEVDGESPGGVEFLRMRPERRTPEMARDWWEKEAEILERRRSAVDRERQALEEGAEVWKGAVKLVTDFEVGLQRELSGSRVLHDKGKGKAGVSSPVRSPEQAMFLQLEKIGEVMTGLEKLLQTAEEKGWNLLICAIGAELEAFRQADEMLREALYAAGFDPPPPAANDKDEQQGDTPRLGRSTAALKGSAFLRKDEKDSERNGRGGQQQQLLDLRDGDHQSGNGDGDGLEDRRGEEESDNEVPADLLVGGPDERELASPTLSREDSENEVPPEFLAEHPRA